MTDPGGSMNRALEVLMGVAAFLGVYVVLVLIFSLEQI